MEKTHQHPIPQTPIPYPTDHSAKVNEKKFSHSLLILEDSICHNSNLASVLLECNSGQCYYCMGMEKSHLHQVYSRIVVSLSSMLLGYWRQ
jgi:hypothetical protein